MRIAYLLSQYPALSHTFLFREISGLRARGFDIRVCSINAPDRSMGAMPPDEAAEVSRTVYIKPTGVAAALRANAAEFLRAPVRYVRGLVSTLRAARFDLARAGMSLFYFAEAVMVGRWMRQQRCAHLHVHFGTPVSTVAWIAAKLFPITYSLTIHGPDEFYNAGPMLLREKIAAARFVLCISDFARSQLMLLSDPANWAKLRVVRLGVDPSEYADATAPKAPLFRVLCVARYAPAKGLDLLIRAAARLIAEGRDLQVRIAGDGPDRDRLSKLSASLGHPCELLGPVPRTRVPALLGDSHAFVLPSFAEGVPVSLMEAMASGVPCISTRIAGIPELIRDGEDGMLIPPGNLDELAAAMARLMDHPELRARLADSARRRVSDHYNLDRNLDILAAQFHQLLNLEPSHAHQKSATRSVGDYRFLQNPRSDPALSRDPLHQQPRTLP